MKLREVQARLLFKLQLQIEQSRVLGADALQAQLQQGLFGLCQIEPWFLSVLNQILQNHQLRLLALDAVCVSQNRLQLGHGLGLEVGRVLVLVEGGHVCQDAALEEAFGVGEGNIGVEIVRKHAFRKRGGEGEAGEEGRVGKALEGG